MNEPRPTTLVDHLEELRSRLLWSLAAYVMAFFVCYSQTDFLLNLVMKPLRVTYPDIRLTALTITEGFFTTMKLAAWAALILVIPVFSWHLWRFVSPGLLPRERRFAAWSLLPM
ncbi:MAG TPA: twin-arginine translocase subunit TatC, partial [Candidatus Ozemobacteraceae bacterium]|nr:twin-arginine translocase subunit TatC [Candidatus Ozemobacteraceae bacterium]